MSSIIGGLLDFSDRMQVESMKQRLVRNQVLSSNIANAETPGFRALAYSFEEQLQAVANTNDPVGVRVSNPKHLKNSFTEADGKAYPDVYVRPTETIPQDGNTVDVDLEMAQLAENQISYRAAIEILNKKIGVLRYAITNGGR